MFRWYTLYYDATHYNTIHHTTPLTHTTNTHTHTYSGIWRQKNVKIKKNVISFFGADVTSDVGIHVNKGAYVRYSRTFTSIVQSHTLIFVRYLAISLSSSMFLSKLRELLGEFLPCLLLLTPLSSSRYFIFQISNKLILSSYILCLYFHLNLFQISHYLDSSLSSPHQ